MRRVSENVFVCSALAEWNPIQVEVLSLRRNNKETRWDASTIDVTSSGLEPLRGRVSECLERLIHGDSRLFARGLFGSGTTSREICFVHAMLGPVLVHRLSVRSDSQAKTQICVAFARKTWETCSLSFGSLASAFVPSILVVLLIENTHVGMPAGFQDENCVFDGLETLTEDNLEVSKVGEI